jgi:AICAR transformylase/IMP cyclohydrolase PurH
MLTIYHVSVFVCSSLAAGLCHGTVCFAKYHSTGRSVSRQTVEIATQQGPQQKSTPNNNIGAPFCSNAQYPPMVEARANTIHPNIHAFTLTKRTQVHATTSK